MHKHGTLITQNYDNVISNSH